MSDKILLASGEPEKVLSWLKEWTTDYDVSIYVITRGMDVLEDYDKIRPKLIIIDACLPDINGMSLATVIKDTKNGDASTIYLYNLKKVLQNTKADFFFLTKNERDLQVSMHAQIHTFLEKSYQEKMHTSEIIRAEKQQFDQLPSPIDTGLFKISSIFSPMTRLSGDCYDYWMGEDDTGLYGFLFDCAGHDISSFSQVSMIRSFLKKSCKLFQVGILEGGLAEILGDVNHDLFTVDSSPQPTAAIVFHIDFKKKVLEYSTAGIPSFFLRKEGEFKIIEAESFLLGCFDNVTFEVKTLALDDVDEIIFSSDGFSELIFHQEDVKEADLAKHDDVSAITIWLKRTNQDQQKVSRMIEEPNVIALS